MKNYFDKNMSICLKGIGILLLLFHHLFYSVEIQEYIFRLCETTTLGLYILANQAKICVTLFLVLSGYGQSESFKNTYGESVKIKKGIQFSFYHILKIYINFWYIYIIFSILGIVIGKLNLRSFYNGDKISFLKEILGMTGFFTNTATINSTWWFISAILLCYILFPFFVKLVDEYLLIAGSISCILFISTEMISKWPSRTAELIILNWTFPFLIGIIYSRYNILNRLYVYCYNRIPELILLLVVCTIFRYYVGYKVDVLPATVIIILGAIVIGRIGKAANMLKLLGNYSMDIFLFHTFFFVTYFREEVYSLYFPTIIYIVFVAVCLITAIILGYIKKICKFQYLEEKIRQYSKR